MKISATFYLPIILMGVVSCGPTTELTELPFKLTSDFTSSTSGSTILPDPSAQARQRLEQFVAYAYNDVTGDIAQGHGEYLTSLAVLAGVPIDAQTAFHTEMQSRYAALSDSLLSQKEARTLVVNYAWSAGYGRTEKKQNSSAESGS